MTTTMTVSEREAFLADVHVGILSLEEPGRGPLTAPIWYDYEPGGELWVLTGPESRKGRLLRVGGRISLCAQTESAPYKYVSVEGPVTSIDKAETERDTRPMARRYLGERAGDQYVAATGGGGGILVRMRPERWLTVDYAKQFST
jgi:nitroimidazol reductase NimA-like FMN-containing flavoprotein (pyridoxamine 5'-phosphate oxidase superfamily)